MAGSCPANRFVTFFLCQINPETWELAYCNAGHNPPYLIGASGDVRKLAGGGLILGVFPGITYTEQVEHMHPGDIIVLYSDGVTESVGEDGEDFGEEKFLEVLIENRTAPLRKSSWRSTRLSRPSGARQADDITLVVARRAL